MITKRTQNASLIRFKVINYVIDACKTKDFKSVHVTEICKASGISKVTFFKYFDHKEDILMLYQSIINTGLCIDISKRDLHATAGIEYVIDRFANIIRDTPSIASEIVSSLLHARPPILPVILTESDKSLFFADIDFEEINYLSFWDLMEGFMLEAVLNNEIGKMSSASELTHMFMATMYGAIVTSHIKGQGKEAIIFTNVTRSWLKNLR